ncbi:MAG: hypothetical protein A2V93_00055 [Ignavibacteria bacterium RBG_16_34_14]|nr:MAG: hypothetical protein A2V93_00055 [Ignavibacteria bacterium RBG_16_34_14]
MVKKGSIYVQDKQWIIVKIERYICCHIVSFIVLSDDDLELPSITLINRVKRCGFFVNQKHKSLYCPPYFPNKILCLKIFSLKSFKEI